MSIETEIKLKIRDCREFLDRLCAMAPKSVSERHLEDNYLLDFADGRMKAQYCLIRVRSAGAFSSMTFKGPARPTGPFKVREEIETPVQDGGAVLAIFDKLGLQTWFRYQKFRQEYSVCNPASPDEILHVALDETPVGDYAEIEGSEEGIRSLASALGFDESAFLRESYYALYLKFCRDFDIKPGHMIFSAGQPKGGGILEKGCR